MIELCACGHELDHHGKRCSKPVPLPDGTAAICSCPSGIRVDLATFQVMVEMQATQERTSTTLMRILAVIETATRLQSSVVDAGDGRFRVDVQPRNEVPTILLPR